MSATKAYTIFTVLLIFIGVIDRRIAPNGIDYIIYICFIATSLFVYKIKLKIPFKYVIACICLLLILVLNSVISKYTPSKYLVIFSIFLTLLPFIQFIISYNYKITKDGLEKILSSIYLTILLILVIAFVETINTAINKGILTTFFGGGFVASLANQAFIITLYKSFFCLKENKLFKIGSIVIPLFIIWTLQLKAIAGMFLIIIVFYFIYYNGKTRHFIVLAIISLPLLLALFQIPALSAKTETYQNIYLSEDNDDVARVALYMTSFEIVKDFFPFGSGPGTYGSPAVNIEDSKVYSDYGLADMWGISDAYDVNFKLDVQWASSLGELGIVGFIILLYLYFFPIHCKGNVNNNSNKGYQFFMLSSICVVFIESIPLTIAYRISFIMIYSGISGIMYSLSKKR